MRTIFTLIVLAGMAFMANATQAKEYVATCKFKGTTLSAEEIQAEEKSSGFSENVQGNIKFTEVEGEKTLKVKIKLQGLQKNKKYSVAVHTNGDTSKKCAKIGDVFQKPQGNLVTIIANNNGEIDTTIKGVNLKISGSNKNSILGRSCAVQKPKDQSFEAQYTAETANSSNSKVVDCARIEG